MKSIAITNVQELRSEIHRLSFLDDEQRLALGQRFRSPAAIFSSALTLFPRSSAVRGITDAGLFQEDFFSLISRFLIPVTLNKTLFRHSNFLVKLLVGLVSQKAAGYITGRSVENAYAGIQGLFRRLFAKKEPVITEPNLIIIKPAD